MRNISDNELDKLFQDAAQRIEPEFDPGDWDKLSKRIDRSDRINFFKRIAIYLSLALLIMFSAWLGINYFQGQSDTKNNSVNNSDASIDKEVLDHDVTGETQNSTHTNASAEYAGIDSDENASASAGSSQGQGASASTQEQQEGETSSPVDKTSSESNADEQSPKDIAVADQDRAITSTAGGQASAEDRLKHKNTQDNSASTAGSASPSARIKNQNGNTINKSAGNDQQSIQKRTVRGEKENREEGSLSASGNDQRIEKDKALISADQQKRSIAKKEENSAIPHTSSQNENAAAKSTVNAVSSEGLNNDKQGNATIASDSQRLSSASIRPMSEEKQQAVNANNDTPARTNAGVDVKKDSQTVSDQRSSANNQSNRSDQLNAGVLNSSSDSAVIANADATAKKGSALKDDNAALENTAANQFAKNNMAGSDSISTEKSAVKSKDNTSPDGKYVTEKSISAEKETGLVLNDASVKESVSKEDSLRGTAPVSMNAYKGNKGISDNDSVLVEEKDVARKYSATSKIAAGSIENVGTQSENNRDSIAFGSDSLLRKEADSNSNAIYTSDKNRTTVPPIKKGEEVMKSSEENNKGVIKQTTSSAGILSDSVNNESESASTKSGKESDSHTTGDSTLTEPLVKADSLNHAMDNKETAEDTKKNDKTSKESNWYVKLLVSPDFSAIGYNKPGKTGVNIGLMAEYSPSKHWGISTGAIWSKKLYDKNNPGKSYSYGGASFEADYLDGDCRVLDIPINITYYILPEARLNFYATVGASSYIMLKENYVYVVTENNNNFYYYEDYKNQNRHWFSMLNLSFGLQYRINPRMQLQVEPFLKAPMSGVGQGKIDLVSAGSFFTLKYGFK